MQDPNEFYILATIKAHYRVHPINIKLVAKGPCQFGLDVSANLEKEKYFSAPGLFNKEGCFAFQTAITDALVASIHLAAERGWMDSAENLRLVIEEITNGWAEVPGKIREQREIISAPAPTDPGISNA